MSAPYLEIRGLSQYFGDFAALESIDLTVGKGEFVCFLGPSGCGKTTLLRAIAGLERQSAGSIFINQRDVSGLPPAERDFGIVFQSYALFPNLKVSENVAYGLHGRGMKSAAIRQRTAELLELVGLPEQSGKYPSQLSGGQQQRVALARALATSPGLLLLDEPLSALDARVRAYLRSEIKALQRRLGITTIMVTHDQDEALAMADRIVVMNRGRIEQVGSPDEVYVHPKNAFVADFIGEMNFIPAQVSRSGFVQVGGLEIAADTAHLQQPSVVLAIRPEDIVLQAQEANGHDIRVNATLTASEYMGSFIRASLSSAVLGDTLLRADVDINLAHSLGLGRGMGGQPLELPMVFPAGRIRLFDQVTPA